MNEVFLPSSTIRDNVVNIAKLLNYVPRSITCAKACVMLEVQTSQTNQAYPSSVTLKRGPVARGSNYIWNILEDITVEVDTVTGKATFPSVTINEGSIINFSYTVNTFQTQEYKIPSEDADIETLRVTVKANESSTTSDLYNMVETVTNLSGNTRSYFLSEGEDMRYQVRFGDDSIGRKLKDGEVINFEYLTCSGKEANEVTGFGYIGTMEDSNNIAVANSDIILHTKQRS